MRKLSLIAALALTSLALPAGPAQAATRMCANTYGGDVIAVVKVRCSKARAVVRTWARRYRRDGRVDRTAYGYRCRDHSNSVEGLVVRCRRGGAKIRFYANVP